MKTNKRQMVNGLIAILTIATMLTATGCDSNTESRKDDVTTSTTSVETKATEATESTDSAKETEATKAEDSSKEEESKAENSDGRVVLDVKHIYMLPKMPRGSELTSAAMVLNYYGIECTNDDLFEFMPISESPDKNGVWQSPNLYYIGSPYKSSGYGMNIGPTLSTIKDYHSYNDTIRDFMTNGLKEADPTDLYKEIDAGNPVIVWATTGMKPSKKGKTWAIPGEDSVHNASYTWIDGQQCFVLIGYDKNKDTVILDDPANENGIVEYPRKTFEARYAELSNQAIVLHMEE